uniref:NADH-ubiquinone oxidoreductase chain 4 n=1 Tax=Columbicola passerinae TaxID=128994 RepID=A0A6G8QS12_9NEOP|nr:NADH dehydrogenase subunit 4 [Columbicola passerinae]
MVFILIGILLSFVSQSVATVILVMSSLSILLLSFEEFLVTKWFFVDYFSQQMVILLVWLFFVILISTVEKMKMKFFLMNSLVFICGLFFITKSVLLIFILFELSIFPILILVLGWGAQPERIQAGFFLLAYTLFCSCPLFLMVCYSQMNGKEFIIWSSTFLSTPFFTSTLFTVFLLLGFLSKIPIFLTHIWLPKAHVEATMQGSMFLAGILLKLGVFGLIRTLPLLEFMFNKALSFFMAVSIFGTVFAALIASSSDDVKMTIAYASVSHMNLVIFSIFTQKLLGKGSAIITSFSHGMSSSLLFFSVYLVYNITHSRSMLLNKGISGIFPILILVFFLSWALNLSIPPSMGFWGELLSVISSFSFFVESTFILGIYFLLSSFYSMFSFGVLTHSESSFLIKHCSGKCMDLLSSFLLVTPLVWWFSCNSLDLPGENPKKYLCIYWYKPSERTK